MNLFREMMEKGIKIKLIGDSITAGAGASDDCREGSLIITIDGEVFQRQLGNKCFASLFRDYILSHYPHCLVVNNGCSGIDSSKVRRYLDELVDFSDELIILMIGTNDRRQLKGPDLLRENLLYMLQMFEESGKKVVLMSANPVVLADDQKENRYHHYVMIEDYLNVTNQTIDELMLGPDKKGDGLHPNDEVYQLMFKHMINSLEI